MSTHRNASRDERNRNERDFYEQFRDELVRGPLDMERRAKAEESFLFFAKTYGANAFKLAWSPHHIRAGELIEVAARTGDCFAFAMPRGSGKTTLSRWGVIWAIVCGYSPYSVLIGKTAKSADKLIRSVKNTLQHNRALQEDFPELLAFRHIKGDARRAQGQLYRGEPSGVIWQAEQIIFPSYELGEKVDLDYVKCSSAIIDVASMDGEIRGRYFEKPDGSIVRPTLAIVDDPQDRKSAKSQLQCEEKEEIIKADVRYLAGPEESTGVIIPCTVVYQDDLAEKLLDRSRNPEFQGETTSLLIRFPWEGLPEEEAKEVRLAWDEYDRIRREAMEQGLTGKRNPCNEYYARNRWMDGNAETSWPERFHEKKGEISSIQHALNLFLDDEPSFFAEYQNKPQVSSGLTIEIPDADEVRRKILKGVPRFVVPDDTEVLTYFSDVSQNLLWYMVVAWWGNFSGHIVDYGAFPEQSQAHYLQATVKRRLVPEAERAIGQSVKYGAALAWGLCEIEELVLAKTYYGENGREFRIERAFIDKNWIASTRAVEAYCKRSERSGILEGYRGKPVVNPDDPLINPKSKPVKGERRGVHWTLKPDPRSGDRQVLADVNWWKTQVMQGISVAAGDPGSITLYDAKPYEHRMISEHLTAEDCKRKKKNEIEFDQWDCKSGRDNHLFDCLVGNAVGASMQGIKRTEFTIQTKKKPRRSRGRSKVTF